MRVKLLKECGYEQALFGMALSYYREGTDIATWWTDEQKLKAAKRLKLLAFKGGGHNKAIESIQVWLLVTASRGFWQEFDTYRVGITKNSASSMHTLDKAPVTADNFECGTSQAMIDEFNNCLAQYKDVDSKYYKDITRLKDNLPEGYLQTRQISTNYMTLQNIIRQRDKHRLKYWSFFIDSILEQIEHPELLENRDD